MVYNVMVFLSPKHDFYQIANKHVPLVENTVRYVERNEVTINRSVHACEQTLYKDSKAYKC